MTTPTPLVVRSLACGHHPLAPSLRGVDLTLEAGQTGVLCGPSGCGKTTLLKTVLGMLPPISGELTVLGQRLPNRPTPGLVGYIPQGLGLVRHVSALRNVLMGTLPRTGTLRSLTGRYPRHLVESAHEALEALGIAHKADEKPIHMSGGERRRVAIARALVQRPRLLLADEILSELDVNTQRAVLDALQTMQRRDGTAILLVEHNLAVAWDVADVMLCLRPEAHENGARICQPTTLHPREDSLDRLKEVALAAP